MTITTRSRRKSAFTSGYTPADVGPGAYAHERVMETKAQPRCDVVSSAITAQTPHMTYFSSIKLIHSVAILLLAAPSREI
jgi:hypothetical protein